MSALAPDRLLAAALAFVLWGGWALLANWSAGHREALAAGLLQGCASAIITLLMAVCANALFARLPGRVLRIAAPPLLIVSVSFSALWLAHTANDTPALWSTILPPSGLAFAYCLYLTFSLARDAATSEQ
ncbi:MAG TPA: hypothetical protein ENI17_11685 [Pseudomonas xinjiangensis]|uniref:Transmembrane protein n=2 Tax=root TaxID=1 RepID=A0A7V1FQQ9_9GAMM|nr:hypothetical protein [Halopseudomonas xinjiangensis]HEC48273.1 hypothetical protein [Halopseudomonas xinjiangensis]